jgi:glutamine synthetase
MDHDHLSLYNQYNLNQSMLDQSGKIVAEYVWIDGSGITLRAKCRTLNIDKVRSLSDLPEWNFDGSSCYMATTENSEVILKPCAYYRDPFRGGENVLVMCETFKWEDNTCQRLIPANTNFRHHAKKIFDKTNEKPWFGIEQEYTLIGQKTKFTTWPLGWPSNGYPGQQGPYYCSAGANVCFGRIIADSHYRACLYAGVNISGTNAEVMPGQWEYQVGPTEGIAIGDQLWMSRYLLQRVGEDFNVTISFAPKLFDDWNGSGCHTNFSTETMRAGTGGMKYIEDMMAKFAEKHTVHIGLYGDDNQKRLTGIHETSSMDTFSFGVSNRAASFRIPTQVAHDNGKGYIEDRRPASNIDPYIVSSMLVNTGVLETDESENLIKQFQLWKSWRETEQLDKIL